MTRLRILILLLLLPTFGFGQTVKCNFTLNTAKMQNVAGNEIYAALKNTVTDFINTNTWIDRSMQPFEAFECNIILTLTEQTSEYEFRGTLQVQAQRPVYNSMYNSVTLNAIDNDVQFRFSPNESFTFSLMSHHPDNLAPLLAYWIYIVIGLDCDTFAPLGGTEIFRTAQRIVNNAQIDSKPGWAANTGSVSKNRYWLAENLLSKPYEPARKALYTYHRLGMDVMNENFAEGKKNILAALQAWQEFYKSKPDNTMYFLSLIFDAKADELTNIFMESDIKEKNDVYTLLSQINVVNEPKYKRLKQ